MTKKEMINKKRENRRKKWHTEERLDTSDIFNNRDLTPYNAVNRIRGNNEIAL